MAEIELEIPAAGDSESLNCDEVKKLKSKIVELETRCSDLVYKNEKLNLDLSHEKHRVVQMERQLQFVKDNQSLFEKMREAYLNLKYNEKATGQKLVEIRDKSVQTWDGVLCRACLDTEKLRAELEKAKTMYSGCIVIKRNEMTKLTMSINALKNFLKSDAIFDINKSFDLEAKNKKKDCAARRIRLINSRSLSVDRGHFNRKRVLSLKCKTSKSELDVRRFV